MENSEYLEVDFLLDNRPWMVCDMFQLPRTGGGVPDHLHVERRDAGKSQVWELQISQ